MGFAKVYFETGPDDPPPLTVTTSRRVRFEEVDLLQIVWHGNYVSFLDDGRVAFGDLYPALSYNHLREKAVAAPIVQMHIDYLAPLRFDEVMAIETTLHWADALKINFSYKIFADDGRLAVRAYTVQLFTDPQGNMLLVPTDWIEEFRNNWRTGELA
ncbi:MAG: acyl-CoA thioesterase [Thermodesulfobacteriota bacterium]